MLAVTAGKLLNHFKLFLSAICSILLRKSRKTNGIDKDYVPFLYFEVKMSSVIILQLINYFLEIVSFNSHINVGVLIFFKITICFIVNGDCKLFAQVIYQIAEMQLELLSFNSVLSKNKAFCLKILSPI